MADGTSVESKVYSAFREDFIKLRGQHKLINKVTNPKLPLPSTFGSELDRKEAQYAIYGGAFIRAFVKWDAFVQDFLEETFLKLIEIITSKSQPPKQASKLLEKAFEEWHKEQKKLLPPQTAQQLSVQLVLEQDKWKNILDDHAKKACKGCTPVFHGDKGITKYLERLFLVKVDLAEELLKLGPIKLSCIINKPSVKIESEPFLNVNNPTALETVTRLLYGVRCVLAHSKYEKTFLYGALSDFPDQSVFLKQMDGSDPLAAEQVYTFYTRAEAVYEKSPEFIIQIYYCDIVNLQRFILQMASRLHNTVVKLIEDHYGLQVWNMLPFPE